ncbi:MAG: SpoIIE family protein phosphatase [Candidatus Brocadiae bacterium]|nr:SpoIIE family protein phosphatase [Candidatus Brocadiia bacterium]
MKDIREVNEGDFGDILNCINAGVYITDTERRIVFWNRAAELITGHRAQDVLGRPCSDDILKHVDKDGRELCTTDLCPLHRSMILAAPSEAPILVYAISTSGRRLPLSTSTAPVFDEAGNVIGGVEVFRDERENIRQMELARTVQRQMLTQALPEDERVSFAVEYAPAELVGGDFYHVGRLSADEFIVFLADAAGHGVSAALYSALVYSLILECQEWLGDPARLMAELNARACSRAEGLGFFTAVCARLDTDGRTLTFTAAGHPPLLYQHAGGEVELLEMSQLPVGVHAEASYENRTVSLTRGDRLLAYSDGATDIPTGGPPGGEGRLGIEGLRALVAQHPPAEGHELTGLYEALMERCVAVQAEDDITLVSCLVL